MPSFDDIAKHAFTSVTALMGESAVWHSSLTGKRGGDIEGRVLFRNPTEPLQIGDTERYEYRPNTVTVEYYEGAFTGLKEAVDAGQTEYITVRGQKHQVAAISTKFDGKTHVAHLEPHSENE